MCHSDNCLQKTDETLLNHYYRDSLLTLFRVEIAFYAQGLSRTETLKYQPAGRRGGLFSVCSFLIILWPNSRKWFELYSPDNDARISL